MFRLFLIMIGTMAIMLSVFRHVAKRRQFGDSYTKYIKEHKLPPFSESNDLGQKVKWVIEPDEQEDEPDTGSAESPADEGG